jgi:PAS domain S-box-containing protein
MNEDEKEALNRLKGLIQKIDWEQYSITILPPREEWVAGRVLLVEFGRRPIHYYERLLRTNGYEVHTFRPQNEPMVHEQIVERVTLVAPDLLMIGLCPSPMAGSVWGRQYGGRAPVGLESVELLRQTSNVPVVFINGWYNEWNWDSRGKLGPRLWAIRPFAVIKGYSKTEFQYVISQLQIREAINRIRSGEERFRTVFHATPDVAFIKDTSLKYTHVNPAMELLYGKKSSELIGLRDEDLLRQEDVEHIKELEWRVLQGESIEEQRSRSINGADLTFLDLRVPLRGASGEIVGICGFSRDITDRQSISLEPRSVAYAPSCQALDGYLEQIRVAAEARSTVLLLGESGSGKDYFARHIHDHSSRSAGPFYAINCAALPEDLLESELFGYEEGAFSEAKKRKRGQLELAEGGTILLNEIGELPLPLQSKLLTFLDNKEFMKLGGEKLTRVDIRLIAATNRDLEQEVKEGRFRQDLFYRINVMSVVVPPLRERREEIPALVHRLLTPYCEELGLAAPPTIDHATMALLQNYDWPGNVRELRNVLERAMILGRGKELDVSFLKFQSKPSPSTTETATRAPLRPVDELTDHEFVEWYREVCVRTYDGRELGTAGSAKAMRMVCDCDRRTIWRRSKRLDLPGIKKGPVSKASLERLIRELESWLARHGFESARAPQ